MNKRMFWLALLPALCASASAGTFDFVVETTTANQKFAFQTDNAANFSID